ncbi:MAG: hypothetical protein U0667_11020 [Chloroflexota bacterium]
MARPDDFQAQGRPDAHGPQARPDAPSVGSRPVTPGPRTSPGGGAPKRHPDARPTRVVLGVGTFAAMSIVTAGLVRFPVADAPDPSALASGPMLGVPQQVVHRIRYVQLKRGEKAPPGAMVIHGADPTPRVVVRTIPAPRNAATTPRRPAVARTRQSGR